MTAPKFTPGPWKVSHDDSFDGATGLVIIHLFPAPASVYHLVRG